MYACTNFIISYNSDCLDAPTNFSATLTSLSKELTVPMIIWARFSCVLIISSIWAVVGKIKLKIEVEDKKLLLLRSLFGMAGYARLVKPSLLFSNSNPINVVPSLDACVRNKIKQVYSIQLDVCPSKIARG